MHGNTLFIYAPSTSLCMFYSHFYCSLLIMSESDGLSAKYDFNNYVVVVKSSRKRSKLVVLSVICLFFSSDYLNREFPVSVL